MKIAVISPGVPKNIKGIVNIDEYVVYACDDAVSELLRQGIKIDLAIGDFDSLQDHDLLKGLKTIKLNKKKDFSDTSYAINHAYNHSNKVVLIGGIKGSRVDHFLANVVLLDKYKNLVMFDDTNKLYILEKGTHNIYKENYDYLTILPVTNSIISISGTKYILNKKELEAYDTLGLSNEIVRDKATIEIDQGKVLVVQSK